MGGGSGMPGPDDVDRRCAIPNHLSAVAESSVARK